MAETDGFGRLPGKIERNHTVRIKRESVTTRFSSRTRVFGCLGCRPTGVCTKVASRPWSKNDRRVRWSGPIRKVRQDTVGKFLMLKVCRQQSSQLAATLYQLVWLASSFSVLNQGFSSTMDLIPPILRAQQRCRFVKFCRPD